MKKKNRIKCISLIQSKVIVKLVECVSKCDLNVYETWQKKCDLKMAFDSLGKETLL